MKSLYGLALPRVNARVAIDLESVLEPSASYYKALIPYLSISFRASVRAFLNIRRGQILAPGFWSSFMKN